MKYIIMSIVFLLSSVVLTHAQTATMPKTPPAALPKAPAGAVAKGPCDAEMKAAMKNMPKIEPGKDPKSMPKPNVNSAEVKALQECMKKNAPKGGAPAPTTPPPSDANAKITDPTKGKVKAPPAGTPPAAPVKAGFPPAGKQGANTTTSQCVNITKELKVGTQDAEVIALKKFLSAEGLLQGVQNTNYFGAATEKALKEWQKKKGIAQSGTTDGKTRAALNQCTQKQTSTTKVPAQK
jgi:hypothetical protein